MRLAGVLTGAKTKHGRQNLLGYECDKLSAEAANLHWDSYVQPILERVQGIYLANKEDRPVAIRFRLLDHPRKVRVWDNATGTIHTLRIDKDETYALTLQPTSSVFISYRKCGPKKKRSM